MSRQICTRPFLAALVWLVISTPAGAASIDSFTAWALVQDPAHPGMTASVDSASQVTLRASGAIPAGTDIGYQSVNGNTVAGSSSGYYFSASQDFHIAVDFNVSTLNSIGFAAIGFGIGEDGAGTNSAGPVLAILNGSPLAFSGAARIGDATQPPAAIGATAAATGRFFLQYDSLSGSITSGVSAIPGSAAATHTQTFAGLQNNWNDADLLVSFFLRSDDPAIFSQLASGVVTAQFSNFEVIEGAATSVVPLPAAAWLFGSSLLALLAANRGKAR